MNRRGHIRPIAITHAPTQTKRLKASSRARPGNARRRLRVPHPPRRAAPPPGPATAADPCGTLHPPSCITNRKRLPRRHPSTGFALHVPAGSRAPRSLAASSCARPSPGSVWARSTAFLIHSTALGNTASSGECPVTHWCCAIGHIMLFKPGAIASYLFSSLCNHEDASSKTYIQGCCCCCKCR